MIIGIMNQKTALPRCLETLDLRMESGLCPLVRMYIHQYLRS